MQDRYLILRLRDPRALLSVLEWLKSLSGGQAVPVGTQCVLWASSKLAVTGLQGDGPLVLGTIYPTEKGASGLPALPADPGAFVKSVWGSYLTYTSSTNGSSFTVLRAPMGALPCYYASTEAGLAFVSDVPLLAEAGLIAPTIGWDAMRIQLATPAMSRQPTCIEGVQELPHGCAALVDVDDRLTIRPVWSYRDNVVPAIDDFGEATQRLRETITAAANRMADGSHRLAVSLSGGLDSAIVAASLRCNERPFTAFTFVGADPDADETRFSRPLARYLGLKLLELPFDPRDVDLRRSSACHLPRPVGHAHTQAVSAACRRLGDSLGIDAVWTGMGGDNVFCSNQSALPLVDRLLAQGFSPALGHTWQALRAITGATGWDVIAQAMRIYASGREPAWRSPIRAFLPPDLADVATDPLGEPHLQPPATILPGKRYHAEIVSQILPFVEGFDRSGGPAWVSPLLAQPVVELCLRIATWLWCQTGWNRAVAREAFRPFLPDAIIRRRSKGGPDSVSRDIAMARQSELRSILLEGQLVKRGLLDRAAVERALTPASLHAEGHHGILLHLADIEAWVAHWAGAGEAMAARRAAFMPVHRR